MNNVARSSCVVCHLTKPRTEMKQRTFNEHAGTSVGASTNTKRKNSTRISGRSYTRARKKWVCNDCWNSRPKYFSTIMLALVANPIFIPKYQGYSGVKSFFYVVTAGIFTLGWLGTLFLSVFGNLRDANGLPNSRIF